MTYHVTRETEGPDDGSLLVLDFKVSLAWLTGHDDPAENGWACDACRMTGATYIAVDLPAQPVTRDAAAVLLEMARGWSVSAWEAKVAEQETEKAADLGLGGMRDAA